VILIGGCPSGMYILNTLPEGVPRPEPFVEGSRAVLEQVTRKIEETYHSDESGAVAAEWVDFRDNIAPQSDDVAEHLKLHPEHWHIPLHNELFDGAIGEHGEHIPPRARKSRPVNPPPAPRDRESKQLDYVQWSRRGVRREKDDLAEKLPNIVVRGPKNVHFSVPLSCRSKKAAEKRAPDDEEPELPVHLPDIMGMLCVCACIIYLLISGNFSLLMYI